MAGMPKQAMLRLQTIHYSKLLRCRSARRGCRCIWRFILICNHNEKARQGHPASVCISCHASSQGKHSMACLMPLPSSPHGKDQDILYTPEMPFRPLAWGGAGVALPGSSASAKHEQCPCQDSTRSDGAAEHLTSCWLLCAPGT